MSNPPAAGRSRGKARGRARQTEEARRPGTEPERGGAAAAPAAVHPNQGNGGGRRTHRGAPRVDPVPVPAQTRQVEAVTEAMSAVSMSETGGRGRSRVGADSRYGDDNTRPQHVTDKRGKTGNPVTLATNFFELQSQPRWCVYQYHCEFSPVVESSRMRRGLLREHKDKFKNSYIFDGMSDLKTIAQVEQLELFSKRITDGEMIRITLKMVAELSPNHPELQRLFNTQMRRNLQHLEFELIGRFYYDPHAVSEVPEHKLQIWQGVITSIRQHEEKVLMCVDTVHKVVRRETAVEILSNIASRDNANFKDNAAKELVGTVVMTRYNNKTYKVEDIDWSLKPASSFETRDGPITYVEYYKKQYDITIKDASQPLLLCTSKEREMKKGAVSNKKIYLVPELCYMTGLTDSMRSNFMVMKELGTHFKIEPRKRVENLTRFIKRINSNANITTEMNQWGLRFADSLVRFQARVVPAEKIVLRGREKLVVQTKDFTQNIRSDPMHVAKNLSNWILVSTKYDMGKANDFLQNLFKVGSGLGMEIRKPIMVEIHNDRIESYIRATNENMSGNTQLVCFIVPNNKKERYDALKKYTCCDNAVPSQVIISRTISKPKTLMTVATKVAIQMNCKLGGEPWTVTVPLKVPIMICGYDTYHDSSRKGRSAGAFVASLNSDLSRWYSKVAFHSTGAWQELSNHMKLSFTEALKTYQEVNNCLPEIILLYRDGVGDGQVRYVLEHEVQQFKSVMRDFMSAKMPKYAFVIVNKRVNARFFAETGSGFNNPPHGTVIDNTVTRYDRYDFYLISQVALQGTVSPTMYNVIEDTSGLAPEHIQRLSYKLTHMYYNYSGTITVPAPCQYAHKLAFLTGQSLHQPPKEELCTTLFYL